MLTKLSLTCKYIQNLMKQHSLQSNMSKMRRELWHTPLCTPLSIILVFALRPFQITLYEPIVKTFREEEINHMFVFVCVFVYGGSQLFALETICVWLLSAEDRKGKRQVKYVAMETNSSGTQTPGLTPPPLPAAAPPLPVSRRSLVPHTAPDYGCRYNSLWNKNHGSTGMSPRPSDLYCMFSRHIFIAFLLLYGS